MGKVSLKVTIAGRTYPLNINEEEQDSVLAAVSDINRSIEKLKKSYAFTSKNHTMYHVKFQKD